MANTIITKNSSTASAVPSAGSLTQGELAVNVTDKKLYTKDASGTVVEITPTNAINATNATTATTTTGNAGTATKLQTARTISLTGDVSGSVSFDGSANASITAVVADGSHNHAAGDITSGTIATARLGSGTASSSTYLRGDSTWAEVASARGGTTSTTSGTNITLTSASTQQQLIKFTAAGLSVSLPNATTLSNSTDTFQIKNTGTELVTVKDYDGNVLCFLTGSVSLSLVGNSASAGIWTLNDLDAAYSPQALSTDAFSSANADSGSYVQYDLCMLTSTTGVAAWVANTGTLWWVRAFTISGGVVTFGTGVSLASSGTYASSSTGFLRRLSDTTFVAAASDGTNNWAWACTVSGTTITAGSRTTLASNAASYQDFNIVRATDTAFLYSFNLNTTGKQNIKYCSVSGTTISVGAAQASTLGGNFAVMGLTYNNSGIIVTASGYVGFSLSGSTVTFGTPVTPSTNITVSYTYNKIAPPYTDSTEPNRVYFANYIADMSGSTVSSFSTTPAPGALNGIYYRNASGQVKLLLATTSGAFTYSFSASSLQTVSGSVSYYGTARAQFSDGVFNSKYAPYTSQAGSYSIYGTQCVRLVGAQAVNYGNAALPGYIETAKILN